MSLGHTEQSSEADAQYGVQEPPYTSAATGVEQVPLGMYMPASLQPAVQVRVPLYNRMSSPYGKGWGRGTKVSRAVRTLRTQMHRGGGEGVRVSVGA